LAGFSSANGVRHSSASDANRRFEEVANVKLAAIGPGTPMISDHGLRARTLCPSNIGLNRWPNR